MKSKHDHASGVPRVGVRWIALLAGFYWWKASQHEKPQIVEVFCQDGKWLVARHARWACVELDKRSGIFMSMIPLPSFGGYSKAFVLNILGAVLACIESLQFWASSHIQINRKPWKSHTPSCVNHQHPDRIAFADWIRANAVLPYRQSRIKCSEVVQQDSYFLANVPSHLPRTVGATDAGSEATKHPA